MAKYTISTVFKAFDQMSGPMKKMGQGLGGLNKTVNMIKTALVGGALMRVGSSFVNAAADVEKYKTTLKTMLGSQEAANARFDEMSKFAAATPFELNEVVQLGNQLQALGRYSTENMTMLGDLAAAAGKPIDQVTGAFAKLASGQKGIAVDMFRDLLVTTQDWVKFTGKGVSKTGELLATTEEMIAALPKILGAKGFAGMMDQQSKTWNGLVSNLKDGLTRIKAGIGEAMLDPLKQIGALLIPISDKLMAWVDANKELIASKFREFLDGVLATVRLLYRLWESGLIPAILAGVVAFKAMAAIMATTAAVTRGLVAIVKVWKAVQFIAAVATKGLTAAQAAFNGVAMANPIGLIIIGIAALIAIIVLLVKNWDAVKAAIGRAWTAVKEFAVGLWTKVVGAFHAVKKAIFDLLDNPLIAAAGAIFMPFITIPLLIAKHWEDIKATIASVIDWVLGAVEKVSSAGRFVSGLFGGGGGGAATAPVSASAGLVESMSTERSVVDLNINNMPAGSSVRQTGRASGVNLNLGPAFGGGW